MIIKGKSRAGPSALAAHLGNAETNEKITLLETRGTIADDLRGALVEMDAYAVGTKCEKPLYHAAMSPEPPHRLTPAQRAEAIDALEAKLGFTGHQRVVVMHEKHEREHIHIVWSRINLETNRSVSDSHNYRKHEEVARDLERRFGHERVQGAHAEREGVERPDRTPSRAELRQEERTGIKGKKVKEDVTRIFKASDGAEAFKAALEDAGYVLAQGDRRDFVIVDGKGGIHSLARRIDGIKAAELRDYMKPIDRSALPNAEQAKELSEQLRARAEEERKQSEAARNEKAYDRGDDYVSQSSAALKDHSRRQEEADARYARQLEERNKATFAKSSEETTKPVPTPQTPPPQKQPDIEDNPDRQPETPGGGRSRVAKSSIRPMLQNVEKSRRGISPHNAEGLYKKRIPRCGPRTYSDKESNDLWTRIETSS